MVNPPSEMLGFVPQPNLQAVTVVAATVLTQRGRRVILPPASSATLGSDHERESVVF